jgi:small ligand-binding sensory domain FIST
MTTEAVISSEYEHENRPAIALWSANLANADVRSFHLMQDDLVQLENAEAVHEYIGMRPERNPSFLLLGDPFSISPLEVLERIHKGYPRRPCVGGLASAGEAPNQNVIVFDGQALRHGLAGIAITDEVMLDTIVSQGARPIGRPHVITKSDGGMVYQLGGKAPLRVVEEMFRDLHSQNSKDAELLQHGILVGQVINEHQQTFSTGDFLVRIPAGFDSGTGAMAMHDPVRTGQTIQFHVRDERSADEDLERLLRESRGETPIGALLFSCNGRGTRMFRMRHHDARALYDRFPGLPIAGAFCAGEIGPIGGRNFLHGFTASIALFRPSKKPGAAPPAN